MFPSIYDNKVLCSVADIFSRTDLGKIFEKCQADEKLKTSGAKIAFDLRNNFGNYEGSELLSHYHEAAYDAYMTGFAFAHILKFKEYDVGPQKKSSTKDKASEEEKKEEPKPPKPEK